MHATQQKVGRAFPRLIVSAASLGASYSRLVYPFLWPRLKVDPPPEADILCEITGHGTIAFELVTIDGRNYCKGRSVYEATARALANACPTHSPQHAALGRKFGKFG